jgi:hypothetical protein
MAYATAPKPVKPDQSPPINPRPDPPPTDPQPPPSGPTPSTNPPPMAG